MKKILASIVGVVLLVSNGQAVITTMFTTQTNQTNQITIQDYEAFKILSYGGQHLSASIIEIQKSGRTMRWDFQTGAGSPIPDTTPVVLTGPAVVRLITGSGSGGSPAAWLTLEITPEPYEVGRSITLAPETGGAAITLECSTNLTTWAAATNGVYTNLEEAKFFRIKAERLP